MLSHLLNNIFYLADTESYTSKPKYILVSENRKKQLLILLHLVYGQSLQAHKCKT